MLSQAEKEKSNIEIFKPNEEEGNQFQADLLYARFQKEKHKRNIYVLTTLLFLIFISFFIF